MTEREELVINRRRLLRNTAREQDLLDGGDGKLIYIFTYEDAIDAEIDWGTSGADSDLNIRTLFSNT